MTFPTKEKDIKLTMIIYKGNRGQNRLSSQPVDALIHYDNNQLVLSINLNKQKDTRKDISLFISGEIEKKDIKILRAEINGEKVKLQMCDNNVGFWSAHMEGNEPIISAELNKVSYKGNEEKTNHFRLSATANDLQSYINTLNEKQWRIEMRPREFTYHGKEYVLMHDEDRVWIETKEDNIDDLLSLISLFYAVPVECDIKHVNGVTTIQQTEWTLGEGKWKNAALSQLFTENESYDWFWTYIKLVDTEHPINEKTASYIREFIRSQLLDEVSKLQNYCAILENAANVNIGEDSYAKIEDYLETYHVVAKKIDGDLISKKIKKNQTNMVTDFYDLRSFFVHKLGSEEARKYLKESKLLKRLALAINIVILHQLGAVDVRFDSMLKNSIFDESIPYGHVYENLFNKA